MFRDDTSTRPCRRAIALIKQPQAGQEVGRVARKPACGEGEGSGHRTYDNAQNARRQVAGPMRWTLKRMPLPKICGFAEGSARTFLRIYIDKKLQLDAETLKQGGQIFRIYCQHCHGPTGSGDAQQGGRQLRPRCR